MRSRSDRCLWTRDSRMMDSMINWANFVSQMFNGLVLGALLALISSGLTIIYGTLGVLNLAHGAMFMLGGYAGYVAYELHRLVRRRRRRRLAVRGAGRRGDGAASSSAISTTGRTRTSCSSPSASASSSSKLVRFVFGSLSKIGAAAALARRHHAARLHVLSDLPAGAARHRRGGAARALSSCSIARASA